MVVTAAVTVVAANTKASARYAHLTLKEKPRSKSWLSLQQLVVLAYFFERDVWGGLVYEVILKRFDKPDAVRNFEKGRFELVKIGKMTIGRATYDPGWKWSEHVGKVAGEKSCMVEHVGLVVAGRAVAAMDDGRVIDLKPGDLFYIAPGHDSWVVGNDPYVSLHFVGADAYAQSKS
jgi:hypothetical protein